MVQKEIYHCKVCPRVDADGHCLNLSSSIIAAAKVVKVYKHSGVMNVDAIDNLAKAYSPNNTSLLMPARSRVSPYCCHLRIDCLYYTCIIIIMLLPNLMSMQFNLLHSLMEEFAMS